MTEPKQHVLTTPQLQTVVSPARHQILRLLASLGEASAGELAAAMERSPDALYYHLRALVEVGLIERREDRHNGARPEAVWGRIARTIVTDVQATSPEYIVAMQKSAAALLRLTDRQLTAALDRQREEGARRHPALRIQQLTARVSPSDLRELNRRLDDILDFLEERDDPAARERVSVTLASAPVAP